MKKPISESAALFPLSSLLVGFGAGQQGDLWWVLFSITALGGALFAINNWPKREN